MHCICHFIICFFFFCYLGTGSIWQWVEVIIYISVGCLSGVFYMFYAQDLCLFVPSLWIGIMLFLFNYYYDIIHDKLIFRPAKSQDHTEASPYVILRLCNEYVINGSSIIVPVR